MRESLARLKLVKAIVAALNRQPHTRARGVSVYEFAFGGDEPDIAVVTRGRALFFAVTTPTVPVSAERLARLDLWHTRANARTAVVDTVAGALSIAAETRADAEFADDALGELIYERQY